MTKRSAIDHKTGQLRNYAVKELYLYIARQVKGTKGYQQFDYARLAHLVGLPWHFDLTSGRNAPVIVQLRAGLERLERERWILVKPHTYNTVLVLLTANPAKLARKYGENHIDRCLGFLPEQQKRECPSREYESACALETSERNSRHVQVR
ncbi:MULTISPECIES: hypothetical protein [Bifidobacterium]|uniref:Uncharacterized protein n=1 Tax=Bifidobacterium callitrichidarum TaxID=2052941 RepID=A0A2U2MZZ0_9BIFI|nr:MULTISPECIES: hypothetical protein [Bifidobacterium]MBW3091088.1 hypothetical protein [Bifidobacterium miconisargentati]PWG62367.1 hypothetical protein DF196_12230 [Bifidobacterium callitrichidarum]